MKELVDDKGTTRGSIEYYRTHRTELGKIKSAKCGLGHLEIEGDEGHMRLSGCTCGYAFSVFLRNPRVNKQIT